MTTAPHILLITGVPGVGKTTVLRRVVAALGEYPIGGFYTEELRERGTRCGFRLVGFDGEHGVIAHVDLPDGPRVGKYRVDVAALEHLCRTIFDRERPIYLVDEIGKMECLAPGFVVAMEALLKSGAPVVATISKKGGGFLAEVKARSDVELWEVTRANRERLPEWIQRWLAERGVPAENA